MDTGNKTVNMFCHNIGEDGIFEAAKKHFASSPIYTNSPNFDVKQIVDALKESDDLPGFGNKLIQLYPVYTEIDLLSKIATVQDKRGYLLRKRLNRYEHGNDMTNDHSDKEECLWVEACLQVFVFALSTLRFVCKKDV